MAMSAANSCAMNALETMATAPVPSGIFPTRAMIISMSSFMTPVSFEIDEKTMSMTDVSRYDAQQDQRADNTVNKHPPHQFYNCFSKVTLAKHSHLLLLLLDKHALQL